MYGGNPSGHRRDSFVHARPLGKRGILLRQQCHHLSELGAFLELPFEGASAREGGGGEGAGGGGGESSREGGAVVRPASVRAPPGNAHAATPQDLTPPPGDAHLGSRLSQPLPHAPTWGRSPRLALRSSPAPCEPRGGGSPGLPSDPHQEAWYWSHYGLYGLLWGDICNGGKQSEACGDP